MDHDQLFKDLLTTFFAEFLELFFPKMAAELDRSSIEFLDKELSTDIAAGERHEVDLLAKVRLRGLEAFILLHVENQSTFQSEFPKRMFKYFAMLHRKFDLPIYPIAIFSYDGPSSPVADTFELKLFDLPILRFQFHAIHLNRLNWREFLTRPNPVANALMTKMRIAEGDRPRVKLECLRMMATLKLDPASTKLISTFMDSYLALTPPEEIVYDQQINAEEKAAMQDYDTILKDLALADGLAKGRASTIVRMLRRLLGDVSDQMHTDIWRLSADQADQLIDAIPDFKSLDDVKVWLANAHTIPPQ